MALKSIQFLAILFWGFQTELLAFAIPMAIILESRFYMNRRWALTKQDFYRTSDLTSLALVGLVVFLFINRADYHFISTLIKWLPIVFFPLTVVLSFSTTERMPLDVLFYSLRRQREPVTQSWDMGFVFFAMCLLSASTNRETDTLFLLVAGSLVFIALFRMRSPRYNTNVWILAASIIFLTGLLTQEGLRGGHLALKESSRRWIANYIEERTNILKTKSALGYVGSLKMSDEILFRVETLDGASPPLLQEASYNLTSDNNWVILNPQFEVVPHAGDFLWRFDDSIAGNSVEQRAKIYLEFPRHTGIVPIPPSVTEIFDLPAENIKKSVFGSIQGVNLVPSPGYEVAFSPHSNINSPPDGTDLLLPARYSEVFDSLTQGFPANLDPLQSVYRVFSDFKYSLYQSESAVKDPVLHFLNDRKAGHCEYFASATVMLLRYLGIPARYVVGYSVQEYNDTLEMYIVRQRHSHAWAIGYIDGQWRVVDTTPSVWLEREAQQSGFLRPVWDFFANTTFMVQVWWNTVTADDYEIYLYLIGALLVLVLIWRIATSEQVVIESKQVGLAHEPDVPGQDSPFFEAEEMLTRQGLNRETGELNRSFLKRVKKTRLLTALDLHEKLRFREHGLSDSESLQLKAEIAAFLKEEAETLDQEFVKTTD